MLTGSEAEANIYCGKPGGFSCLLPPEKADTTLGDVFIL